MSIIRLLSRLGGRSRNRGARGAWRALPLLGLAAALFAAVPAPTFAAAAGTAGTATPARTVVKPTPAPPAGIAVGTANVPKPHGAAGHIAVRPMSPWTVSLSASVTATWPTFYSTLTATSSQDVGPTPYFIYIVNADTGATVASCGRGTTCAVSLTYPTPSYYGFYAIIATSSAGANEQAISSQVLVNWQGILLTLAANLNTLPVGNSSTLTATSNTDISTSPFYIQIWDLTAGGGPLNPIDSCGTGTTCSVTVSQSAATTHVYVATFAYSSASYPPSGLQQTSATSYITWTASGWTVSLNAPAETINGPETVTASADGDVGPTVYYIEIFDENGTLLKSCATGSTCSVSFTPARYPGSCLVAFISSYSTTLPPANIQASSNTACSEYVYIG